MNMRKSFVTAALIASLLGACSEQDPTRVSSTPAPVKLTRDDIGYYCNMIVADHLGPKGQIHIAGRSEPVWFSSARDAIVFTLLPEEPKNITAIYVNDMGRASWERPEPGTWIDAREAWYVIGSDKRGGMGAPEAVPFAAKTDAESFVGRHGGTVVAFDRVPRDYVLEDGSANMQAGTMHGPEHAQHEAEHAQHASHAPSAMPMQDGQTHGHAGTVTK